VIEVHFEKSTKGKALHNALELTQDAPVDLILILDADNHMESGFLKELNNAYAAGYKVVQGHRIAKNINTPFALLDACTEEINNHIFRRGHVALGLPSALIGSGMAFDWKLFNEIMQDIGDTSGEDKELEFRIVRRRIPIAFLDDSHVLDEKVAQSDVFSKQRSRWLATQVEFFQKYFLESWVQLFKGNVAFFNKVFQTYLLPRVLLVVAVLALIFISFFVSKNLFFVNLVLCVLLMLSLLIGIPRNWYNRNLLQAFLEIPGAILGILKSLTQIGKARKQFIHTPHGDANQNHS
jgi:cellulose synthase/poly-beta-1,6-N-acetylglucosamine synthase-like glycosyltransferase